MKKPLVSVIILNWNRRQDVLELLEQLKTQTYTQIEILVVDNDSRDGSTSAIRKTFPKVRLVGLPTNIALAGFSKGMEVARGDYFVLLASDTMVTDNLIEKHVEKLLNNPGLGISCASTFDWETKHYLTPNRAKSGNNKTGYRVTYFDGNGVGVRREVFEAVGGYRADYFICLEELEWAVRVLQAGYEIGCFTDVVVYHKKSEAGGEYRSRLGYYYCRNWMWFYAEYLPIREWGSFLWLHLGSAVKKTGEGGVMRWRDCVRGVLAGLGGMVRMWRRRRVLPPEIVKRVKLDLFPNADHLYVEG